MKIWNVIIGVASTLFVASILTLAVSPGIASAHGNHNNLCTGPHKNDDGCNGDGGGGGGVLRVNVEFRDDVNDSDSPTDGLQSIGGTYKHKEQNVSAGIGGSGEFTLKLTKGNQLAMRTLFLDFTCVSEDTDDCNPAFQLDDSPNSSGDSVGLLTIATTRVDLLALTETETRHDLRLSLQLDLNLIGGGLWHLGYAADGFGICPGGNDIDVTRISADTWKIVATSLDKACLVKRDGTAMGDIPSGLYSMPFEMTVKKQN